MPAQTPHPEYAVDMEERAPAARNPPKRPVFYDESSKTYYPTSGIRPIHPEYLELAQKEPVTTSLPQVQLVILDLNGTMVNRDSSKRVTRRPHLDAFVRFLLQNFRVMVWSSAQRRTVDKLITEFPAGSRKSLDRIWSREDLRLSSLDFKRKVLTLKDLDFVWEVAERERIRAWKTPDQIKKKHARQKYAVRFDQTNTIMIDDSIHKTQLQPYNSIILPDYDEDARNGGVDRELLKVRDYLTRLLRQENVSAHMRTSPFDASSAEFQGPLFEARISDQDKKVADGGWWMRDAKDMKEKVAEDIMSFQSFLTMSPSNLSNKSRENRKRKLETLSDSLKGIRVVLPPVPQEDYEMREDAPRTEEDSQRIEGARKKKKRKKKSLNAELTVHFADGRDKRKGNESATRLSQGQSATVQGAMSKSSRRQRAKAMKAAEAAGTSGIERIPKRRWRLGPEGTDAWLDRGP